MKVQITVNVEFDTNESSTDVAKLLNALQALAVVDTTALKTEAELEVEHSTENIDANVKRIIKYALDANVYEVDASTLFKAALRKEWLLVPPNLRKAYGIRLSGEARRGAAVAAAGEKYLKTSKADNGNKTLYTTQTRSANYVSV